MIEDGSFWSSLIVPKIITHSLMESSVIRTSKSSPFISSSAIYERRKRKKELQKWLKEGNNNERNCAFVGLKVNFNQTRSRPDSVNDVLLRSMSSVVIRSLSKLYHSISKLAANFTYCVFMQRTVLSYCS